jgi:O-antigen/teichoic acid export membrane protein
MRWPRAGGRQTIVANSAYSLISQVSSGAFTAILTLYLVRALAPTAFGNFSLAVGIGALVATPADFGVSSATARFVAEHRGQPARVAAFVADAVRLKLILSVLACGTLFALAGPIAAAYDAPLTWPIRFIALAVLGQNLMFLFEGSFIAAGRLGSYVQVVIGESVTECCSTIVIVMLGGGLIGATAGRALGYVSGAALALLIGARGFRWPSALKRRGRPALTRQIAGYAAPLMLIDAANSLFTMVDILLIGAYLGSHQAGLFSAPARLLMFFFYPGVAVANGIAPRMTRGGDAGPDGRVLAAGMRTLIVFYALLLAPLIFWTEPIVRILLGSNYAQSVPTMRLLSLSVLLGGLAPLVSVSANYLGDASRRVPLMVSATLLNALIDVILIPRIGIISGAIATAVAYGVMLVGHVAICRRHVDLPLGPILGSTLRALLAASAMAVLLVLIGSNPSLPIVLLGLAGGTVVYAGVLVWLREFSPAELAAARRWIRI